MTRDLLVRRFVLLGLLGLLLAPSVRAQTDPLRVVQGSDGVLYLAQGSNAWLLVPAQLSDESVAGLSLNGDVGGALVGQTSPLVVGQGSDGVLYLAQGGNAWTLVPDPIEDDALAQLRLGPEVDGLVPAELLSVPSITDVPTPSPALPTDTPAPAPTAAADTSAPTSTPDTSASPAAAPTATSVPLMATAAVPTAAPLPTSTLAPVPTAVPTMELIGSVTREGHPVANATVRVLELSPLTATSDSGGSFRLAGLQQASYTLMAEDSVLTSSPLVVPQSRDAPPPVKLELVAAPGGQPTLFVGQVQGDNAAGATVWRLGGAGQTRANKDGKFWLVDAHVDADGLFTASPSDAIIVAARGDRWGFAVGPFTDDPPSTPIRPPSVNPLSITLTHTGSPPQQPNKPLINLKDKGNGTRIPPQPVDAIFTALWLGPASAQASFTPAGTSSFTGKCAGACKGVTAQGWAAFLPKGSPATLVLTTEDFANPVAKPTWAEAQVVAYPVP